LSAPPPDRRAAGKKIQKIPTPAKPLSYLFFQMFYIYLPIPISTKSIPAGFLHLSRDPIYKLMNLVESASEVQAAMPIDNQGSRLIGIESLGDDADRNGGVGFRSAEYFMRDKGFLFDSPDSPVDGSRAFHILNKYQNPFMPVIRLLHNFEYQAIMAFRSDIMKYAFVHFDSQALLVRSASAPVGHDSAHWRAVLTRASDKGFSKGGATLTSNPRAIIAMPSGSHAAAAMRTHASQLMHFPGS
jgi:hypothetical protein